MKKRSSFTLIELLVVIVIIGILAGVIMISTSSSISKANITKIKAFSESTKNGMILNLMSVWDFDNVSGTVGSALAAGAAINDSWGQSNGTASNGPILKDGADCIEGQCLKFTGTQFITIPSNSSFDVSNEVTLEAWFYINQYSTMSTGPFLGQSSGFWFWQYPTCYVWEIYNNGTRRNFDLPLSLIILKEWTFLTLIYKNGYLTVYKNGAYYNTKSVGEINIPLSGSPFQIGNANYYGSIDNVKYYNSALNYSEIMEHYLAFKNKFLSDK